MRSRIFVTVYRGAAVLLLNTLLLLIALETGAAVVLCFMPQVPALPAMASPYFAAQAWGRAYWREFDTLLVGLDYHPYILWRTRPFEGRLIRVSSLGLRVHPHSQCARGAYRVWVFGGSTVWGLGSPDDQTIPSHLHTALA
jgi:hypothetical protein